MCVLYSAIFHLTFTFSTFERALQNLMERVMKYFLSIHQLPKTKKKEKKFRILRRQWKYFYYYFGMLKWRRLTKGWDYYKIIEKKNVVTTLADNNKCCCKLQLLYYRLNIRTENNWQKLFDLFCLSKINYWYWIMYF